MMLFLFALLACGTADTSEPLPPRHDKTFPVASGWRVMQSKVVETRPRQGTGPHKPTTITATLAGNLVHVVIEGLPYCADQQGFEVTIDPGFDTLNLHVTANGSALVTDVPCALNTTLEVDVSVDVLVNRVRLLDAEGASIAEMNYPAEKRAAK